MDKKLITQLYQELPELIAKGVLTPEAADNIRRHYGTGEVKSKSTFLLVFGVIGVLLVGLGLILLIAHNWAQLTRANRLLLSVGLLIAGQLAAGITLYCNLGSRVWRESAATLHMLTIGAVLSLVGQTYHLTSDTDMFILTWMLLSLPLMYLLRSSSVNILYLLGVTYWAVSIYPPAEKQLVWLLLALALPYYRQQWRHDLHSNATAILSWVWNICFYGCFIAVFDNYIHTFHPIIYSALFSINYMLGVLYFHARPFGRLPFQTIGLAGAIITTFILTFYSYWDRMYISTASTSTSTIVMVMILLLLTTVGIIYMLKQTGNRHLPFAVAPLIIGSGYLLKYINNSSTAATLLLNIYLLLLSILVIRDGSHNNSLGRVNAGMLLLTVLVVSRFLDANFSFIIRGVVFVCLGIGFLSANWLMVRRKAGGTHEK